MRRLAVTLTDELQKAVTDARTQLPTSATRGWLRPLLQKNVVAIALGRQIYVRERSTSV